MDFGINEQCTSDEDRVSEGERVRGPHPSARVVSTNSGSPFKLFTLLSSKLPPMSFRHGNTFFNDSMLIIYQYCSVNFLLPCQVFFVGWVERSETQHDTLNQYMLGFATLNPTYN